MNRATRIAFASIVIAAAAVTAACTSMSSTPGLGFFVSSTGGGKGADLGGLGGADKLCQSLAANAGAGSREWRAYLSTTAMDGAAAVDARSRIGNGPWYNAKGELIASNLDELHTANKITKQTALTEKGDIVNGRGDTPVEHDVLTGSTTDGRSTPQTCSNWTSSTTGAAIVGHHDRIGLADNAAAKSWNASHPTRGCDAEAIKSTGGAGRLYCFAAR